MNEEERRAEWDKLLEDLGFRREAEEFTAKIEDLERGRAARAQRKGEREAETRARREATAKANALAVRREQDAARKAAVKRALYDAAVTAIVADLGKVSNETIAERLGVDPTTIERGKKRGYIP